VRLLLHTAAHKAIGVHRNDEPGFQTIRVLALHTCCKNILAHIVIGCQSFISLKLRTDLSPLPPLAPSLELSEGVGAEDVTQRAVVLALCRDL
jgi:hypothetical protein